MRHIFQSRLIPIAGKFTSNILQGNQDAEQKHDSFSRSFAAASISTIAWAC